MEKDKQLYGYLKREFYKDNLPKYHKYFEQWYENLTMEQIEGFKFYLNRETIKK